MLDPELTDSYELSWLNEGKYFFTSISLFHRTTTAVLSRIIRDFPGNEDAVIRNWENANIRYATGVEVINQFNPVNWWDATLTSSVFRNQIDGGNIQESFTNSNISYNFNLLTSFKIPDWFDVQIQAHYTGPRVRPQADIEPIYSINAGIKRNFWDKKATISINVSDIFNTHRFVITSWEEGVFEQTRIFDRETRIGTIAFTYRFDSY